MKVNDRTYEIAGNNMETILRIQKYLEDNYSEEITLEEVSRRFYINAFYLSHSFKKLTGFGFKEYLILQRISRAKDFLFHTPDDITRVSLNVGFNNVNHFIRIFKKYEGLTPLQYRKNAGKPGKRLSNPPSL